MFAQLSDQEVAERFCDLHHEWEDGRDARIEAALNRLGKEVNIRCEQAELLRQYKAARSASEQAVLMFEMKKLWELRHHG